MRKTLAAVLTVGCLTAAANAHAAAPPLPLDRADRAAHRAVTVEVADWREMYDWHVEQAQELTPDELATEPIDGEVVYIAAYELDPCERTSARRAECDVTYWLSDGSDCDDTLIVRTTRRGKVWVSSEGLACEDG